MSLEAKTSSAAEPAARPTIRSRSDGRGARARALPHVPGEVGIWVFIVGDMLVFGLFFGTFVFERVDQVELFNQSSSELRVTIGALNTLLLLTSSLFVVLGVRAVREGIGRRLGPALFALAFACGLGFVVNKYLEYSDTLGAGFEPATNDFYLYFYIFTGIHLVHLLIGMGVLVFLWHVARKPRVQSKDIRGMEAGASYWHLVDLLWVVLFALLYLMR